MSTPPSQDSRDCSDRSESTNQPTSLSTHLQEWLTVMTVNLVRTGLWGLVRLQNIQPPPLHPSLFPHNLICNNCEGKNETGNKVGRSIAGNWVDRRDQRSHSSLLLLRSSQFWPGSGSDWLLPASSHSQALGPNSDLTASLTTPGSLTATVSV